MPSSQAVPPHCLHTKVTMSTLSFNFKFNGFVGAGRCGITIGTNPDTQQYVIVCSQKRYYHGTSVTNALEIIATDLANGVISNRLAMKEAQGDKSILDGIRTKWMSKGKSRKVLTLSDLYSKELALWIEHYPANTGMFPGDRFTQVVFDEANNPSWLAGKNTEKAVKAFGAEVVQAAIVFSKKDTK
jgi:hypothetical protein